MASKYKDDAGVPEPPSEGAGIGRSRWPRRTPSLPDLLTYLMDQHGLSRADLVPLLGTASRVSEVLTGKRELSMSMVRKLRERFHIPADLLIPPLRPSEVAA